MNPLRLYWAQGLLGVCALVSGVIFAWPSGRNALVVAAQPEQYSGPVFADRKGGGLPGFPLRLTAPGAAEAPPPAAEALPVLVGIANGQAYLRSAASGEVGRVARGQTIDGWRIASVGARSVTLSNGEAEHTVTIFTIPPATGTVSAVNTTSVTVASSEPAAPQTYTPDPKNIGSGAARNGSAY